MWYNKSGKPQIISADTEKKTGRGKTEIKKPKTITNEDAGRICALLPTQDRLIFMLSLESGLRISDVLKLQRNQIAKKMTVYESKTRKYKTFTVSDELLEQLPKGFAFGFNASGFVFSSHTKPKTHLHRSTYHRHLKNACRALKIDFSAHSTRKLYAHNVFDSDNNIFTVQKSLNHEYITTTAAYMDIDIVQLINTELKNRKEKITVKKTYKISDDTYELIYTEQQDSKIFDNSDKIQSELEARHISKILFAELTDAEIIIYNTEKGQKREAVIKIALDEQTAAEETPLE